MILYCLSEATPRQHTATNNLSDYRETNSNPQDNGYINKMFLESSLDEVRCHLVSKASYSNQTLCISYLVPSSSKRSLKLPVFLIFFLLCMLMHTHTYSLKFDTYT